MRDILSNGQQRGNGQLDQIMTPLVCQAFDSYPFRLFLVFIVPLLDDNLLFMGVRILCELYLTIGMQNFASTVAQKGGSALAFKIQN